MIVWPRTWLCSASCPENLSRVEFKCKGLICLAEETSRRETGQVVAEEVPVNVNETNTRQGRGIFSTAPEQEGCQDGKPPPSESPSWRSKFLAKKEV